MTIPAMAPVLSPPDAAGGFELVLVLEEVVVPVLLGKVVTSTPNGLVVWV